MARTYSKTGCLICKQRKKKCSEERPTCVSCRRLCVKCIYLDVTKAYVPKKTYGRVTILGEFEIRKPDPPSSSKSPSSTLPDQLEPVVSLEELKLCLKHQALSLRAFLDLPFTQVEQAVVAPRVYRLLDIYTKHVVPFRAMDSDFAMFRGVWWEVMMKDQVSSMCLAGICATFELNLLMPNDALVPIWTRIREKAEYLVTNIIKQYVEDPGSVDVDQAILSSANLILILAPYRFDKTMLRTLAAGLETLVNRGGGLAKLAARQNPKFLLNILKAACNVALVSGDAAAFAQVITYPQIPKSLTLVNDLNGSTVEYSTPELQQMVKDMRLLLYFRCSPEQRNLCCTTKELLYLVNLANYVDLRQCHLQSIYRNSSTTDECLLVALILARLHMLGDPILKPRIAELVHARLLSLLADINPGIWVQNRAPNVLLWMLVLALLCNEQHQQRHILLQKIQTFISKIYDKPPQMWPSKWQDDVTHRIQSFLWHARLDKVLEDMLATLQAMNSSVDLEIQVSQ